MLDEAQVEELRRQVDGVIANLPELLRQYLEKLMTLERPVVATRGLAGLPGGVQRG